MVRFILVLHQSDYRKDGQTVMDEAYDKIDEVINSVESAVE